MLFEGKLCGILMAFGVHEDATCTEVCQFRNNSMIEGNSQRGFKANGKYHV